MLEEIRSVDASTLLQAISSAIRERELDSIESYIKNTLTVDFDGFAFQFNSEREFVAALWDIFSQPWTTGSFVSGVDFSNVSVPHDCTSQIKCCATIFVEFNIFSQIKVLLTFEISEGKIHHVTLEFDKDVESISLQQRIRKLGRGAALYNKAVKVCPCSQILDALARRRAKTMRKNAFIMNDKFARASDYNLCGSEISCVQTFFKGIKDADLICSASALSLPCAFSNFLWKESILYSHNTTLKTEVEVRSVIMNIFHHSPYVKGLFMCATLEKSKEVRSIKYISHEISGTRKTVMGFAVFINVKAVDVLGQALDVPFILVTAKGKIVAMFCNAACNGQAYFQTLELAEMAEHVRVHSDKSRYLCLSERMEVGKGVCDFPKRRIHWRNTSLMKSCQDTVMYSQLIQDLRPPSIIEIGSWMGASAAYFADLQQNFGITGRVYSYDVNVENVCARHERCEFHYADASDLSAFITHDFINSLPRPLLVIDDAHFNLEGVVSFFKEYMHDGDYLVIEDMGVGCFNYPSLHSGFKVDVHYCDLFGVNRTTCQNAVFRRFA